jgi:hypothetical protein
MRVAKTQVGSRGDLIHNNAIQNTSIDAFNIHKDIIALTAEIHKY